MTNLFGTQFIQMNTVTGLCMQGIKWNLDFNYTCEGMSSNIHVSIWLLGVYTKKRKNFKYAIWFSLMYL